MKISKERREELKQSIKIKLIQYPTISCKNMSESMKIDKDFANKLMNEVRAENTARLRDEVSRMVGKNPAEEILNIQSELDQAVELLWTIAEDQNTSNNSRIKAINTITSMRKSQFSMKLDAGIFVKKNSDFNMGDLVRMLKEDDRKQEIDQKKKIEIS